MRWKLLLSVAASSLLFVLPLSVWAQSDGSDISLGDLARQLRKGRNAPADKTIIDNDNISRVMDEAEKHKAATSLRFTFDRFGVNYKVSSPDVTCSLAFNGKATALLSNPYAPQDLPEAELAKLDGPANINQDALELSMYNPTGWSLREITLGLTIVRRPIGPMKIIPASAQVVTSSEKHPDTTVLYHWKGSAAPESTTVVHQALEVVPGPDQEWHWAIVGAKGIPPKPEPAADPASPEAAPTPTVPAEAVPTEAVPGPAPASTTVSN